MTDYSKFFSSACPRCKKGYISERDYESVSIERDYRIDYHTKYYFCSNVLCDYYRKDSREISRIRIGALFA